MFIRFRVLLFTSVPLISVPNFTTIGQQYSICWNLEIHLKNYVNHCLLGEHLDCNFDNASLIKAFYFCLVFFPVNIHYTCRPSVLVHCKALIEQNTVYILLMWWTPKFVLITECIRCLVTESCLKLCLELMLNNTFAMTQLQLQIFVILTNDEMQVL